MSSLPPPSADALAHSARLAAAIAQHIRDSGGQVPFSRFMELALYAPGLGYYSAGAQKFGAAGDFVTAPELGGLFAASITSALAPVLAQLPADACFMEVGGGSGAFAEAVLKAFARLDALPARYAILEPSADLRARQQARLQQALPAAWLARVEWLDGPIQTPWQGVLFANEVIDALPATRFVMGEDGEFAECCVGLDGAGQFVWQTGPADILLTRALAHVQRELGSGFAPGYRSELLPQLPYWMQAIAGGMTRGALLFCDYGYPRAEYYAPWRSDGTLRAFRQHHVVDDVLALPGLQDLTTSVEFTALAEAGAHAGFTLAGYCHQAAFLLAHGIDRHLARAQAEAADDIARLRLAHEFKQLVLPEHMGERFQMMGFMRDVAFADAFAAGDMSWRLG